MAFSMNNKNIFSKIAKFIDICTVDIWNKRKLWKRKTQDGD